MRNRLYKIVRIAICVILLSIPYIKAHSQVLEDIQFLEGSFENPIYITSPTQSPYIRYDVCSFFSGNVGPTAAQNWNSNTSKIPPNTPNDGTKFLLQSSIGWISSGTVGWVNPTAAPGEQNAFDHYVSSGNTYNQTVKSIFDLYYKMDNVNDPQTVYLQFNFDPDTGKDSSTNATLSDTLGEAPAWNAQQNFIDAYRINPLSSVPQDGLLDVTFQRSVALIMRGNLELEKAFSVRFLEGIRKRTEAIYDELYNLGWDENTDTFSESNGAWQYFNEASKIWMDLFASPMQRGMLIKREPFRSLVQDGPAFQTPVTVYDAYKDVAVMMRALSQRARVINEVAKRLVLLLQRNTAGTLIENNIQAMSLEESIIYSILFPNGLPADHAEKYPGLAESFLTYRDCMEELVRTRDAALNQRFNPLGFDNDLLVIVPGSNSEGLPYTYDWLRSKLLGPNSQPLGVLAIAKTADDEARNTRKTYEMKRAEFLEQFNRIEDEYDQQLIAICGSDPNDPLKANLTDSEHGGGQLEQQYANVQMAYNRITSIQVDVDNVYARIEIERDRVAKVNGIMTRKADMMIDYGTKQAKLTELIAENQADMALANGLADAASTAVSGGWDKLWGGPAIAAGIKAANALYQHRKLKQIGEKQVKVANLQAEQQANFIYLDIEINDVNSEAQIKTWFLDLRKFEIQRIDAELMFAQELDRLAQYYTEIQQKVMRRDRALKDLTRRSFADPTYRIEVLNTALKAEDSFQAAQKWVYLSAKALEYKWPMGNDVSGLSTVTIPAIVRARLTDSPLTTATLLNYMEQLENIDTAYSSSYGTQLYYWNYSLRKDYLGMTFDKEIPGSGGQVLSPVEQFQQFLIDLRGQQQYLIDLSGDGNPDHLAIPFSTVRFAIPDDNPGSINLPDSQGNQQSADGRPIFDSRLWDDKIDWIQVNIIGNNVYSPNAQLMPIELWYGGSGFIRYSEPAGPPGQKIDFRVIPVPHFTLTPSPRGFGWKGYPYLIESLSAKLVTSPRDVPSEVYRTINFREHPVAATDWKILIPLSGTNLQNIRDIEIIIVHRARTRQ